MPASGGSISGKMKAQRRARLSSFFKYSTAAIAARATPLMSAPRR
ncbi:hypothetical protein Ga0080574_TMP4628 [Salipiger abyssi]|uniref:Uncharacterized protein n=1 Tax=Salipiger abyssi TaxID=1250539 RepID=A0A1P8UZZ2_9RHOB|nr:hypothetical protein Ga0080574_TMP4628 [Salipiger abyssi]